MKVVVVASGACFEIIPTADNCPAASIIEVHNTSQRFKLVPMGELCPATIEMFLTTFMKGDKGDAPYIGENGNWWVGTTDTGVKAEGVDGRGIVSIIKTSTVGLVDTYTVTYSDTTTSSFDVTNGEKGDAGPSAYEIYIAGGGTLSEVDYNESITNVPTHIADATKHIDTTTAEFSGTIDETNDKFTIWDNSLLKWIRFSFTSMKTWLSSLYLKLDQTTPQTLTQSPIINSLVAGDIVVVGADKKLSKITGLYVDSLGRVVCPSTVYFSGQLGGLVSNLLFGTVSGAFAIKNISTNAASAIEIWTKNIKAATFTPSQGLKVVSGIQCGDDTAAASVDKVGTRRYRETANASFIEVCVRTGAATYTWHVEVTYTW